jgi:hypothetical protein
MTPQEFLAEHPLTQEMRRRGAREDQLTQFRLRNGRDGLPFSGWSYDGPGDAPIAVLGIAKAYCALRWLVMEAPPPSRDVDDAWREISDVLAAPVFELGLKFGEKGKKTDEQQKKNQRRATIAATKYPEEMKASWRAIAAEPLLAGKSKSSKAEVIAKRLGLPKAAVRTIRDSID